MLCGVVASGEVCGVVASGEECGVEWWRVVRSVVWRGGGW